MNRNNEHIQSWLVSQQDAAAQPPDELVEHVAGCAECRGALLLLMTTLLNVPAAEGISCAQCQEDLAAYIDEEIAGGPSRAAQAFPEVWWHLWTCQDCAETYQVTLAIVGDTPLPEQAPAAAPWLTAALSATREWLFELPRAILNLSFDPGPLLVPMGDEDDTPLVLLDRERDGHQIVLGVQPQGDGRWSAQVEVAPPLSGTVSLALGETTYGAPLDAQGRAHLGDLPAAQLAAADGPGLLLRIERNS
jgi:hypothetical protein